MAKRKRASADREGERPVLEPTSSGPSGPWRQPRRLAIAGASSRAYTAGRLLDRFRFHLDQAFIAGERPQLDEAARVIAELTPSASGTPWTTLTADARDLQPLKAGIGGDFGSEESHEARADAFKPGMPRPDGSFDESADRLHGLSGRFAGPHRRTTANFVMRHVPQSSHPFVRLGTALDVPVCDTVTLVRRMAARWLNAEAAGDALATAVLPELPPSWLESVRRWWAAAGQSDAAFS